MGRGISRGGNRYKSISEAHRLQILCTNCTLLEYTLFSSTKQHSKCHIQNTLRTLTYAASSAPEPPTAPLGDVKHLPTHDGLSRTYCPVDA